MEDSCFCVDTELVNKDWTTEPNITEAMVTVPCDFNEDLADHPHRAVLNEIKKRMSEITQEVLYENKTEISRLLQSGKSLQEMAQEVGNITTSHLALVLAGIQHFKEINGDYSQVHPEDSTSLRERKHQIAVEGRELAPRDLWSGSSLQLAYNNREFTSKQVPRSESTLYKALTRKFMVPTDSIQTEADLLRNQENPQNTPDILFKPPLLLFGKLVYWMEAKHSLVDERISPRKLMDAIKAQVAKYTEAFGPGAILWTKVGFTEFTQEWLLRDYGTLSIRKHVPSVIVTRQMVRSDDRALFLKCLLCSVSFTFTSHDQDIYKIKSWENPKRCKPCRSLKIPSKVRGSDTNGTGAGGNDTDTSGNITRVGMTRKESARAAGPKNRA